MKSGQKWSTSFDLQMLCSKKSRAVASGFDKHDIHRFRLGRTQFPLNLNLSWEGLTDRVLTRAESCQAVTLRGTALTHSSMWNLVCETRRRRKLLSIQQSIAKNVRILHSDKILWITALSRYQRRRIVMVSVQNCQILEALRAIFGRELQRVPILVVSIFGDTMDCG